MVPLRHDLDGPGHPEQAVQKVCAFQWVFPRRVWNERQFRRLARTDIDGTTRRHRSAGWKTAGREQRRRAEVVSAVAVVYKPQSNRLVRLQHKPCRVEGEIRHVNHDSLVACVGGGWLNGSRIGSRTAGERNDQCKCGAPGFKSRSGQRCCHHVRIPFLEIMIVRGLGYDNRHRLRHAMQAMPVALVPSSPP